MSAKWHELTQDERREVLSLLECGTGSGVYKKYHDAYRAAIEVLEREATAQQPSPACRLCHGEDPKTLGYICVMCYPPTAPTCERCGGNGSTALQEFQNPGGVLKPGVRVHCNDCNGTGKRK